MVGISARSQTLLSLLALVLLFFTPFLGQSAEKRDVVINEIAWMGTEASWRDEWIEFYNKSNKTIDLSNWSIYGASSGECLNFSAANDSITMEIEPHDYLIYGSHKDDVKSVGGTEIVDIWDSSISLNDDSPGELRLYDEKGCSGDTIDTANGAEEGWFAGNGDENKTMERISPCNSGTISDNWGTNDPTVARDGEDADGNPIKGTPNALNSVFSNSDPTAEINSPDSTTVGETIELDGSRSTDCDGFITSYGWDLDQDGNFNDASEETTTYTPQESGDKTIGLKVVDNTGASDSAQKTISVTGGGTNLPPDADPGDIYSCSAGGTATLDGSSSSDPDGTIVSYGWDFDGNGNYDDAKGVRVEYSCGAAGVKSVGLKVTDNEGATDTGSTAVDVEGELTVNFSYTPSEPSVSEEVQFEGDTSTSGSSISSWEWDFDDGEVASTRNPTHSFSSTGSYSVTLTVRTEAGSEDSTTEDVTISSGVSVDAGRNRTTKLGQSLSLQGKVTSETRGKITKTSWSVTEKPAGGGIKMKGGDTASPLLIPNSAGEYRLKLTGESSSGGRATDTATITVEENEAVDPDAFAAKFVSEEDPSFEKQEETGLEANLTDPPSEFNGRIIGYELEEAPELEKENRQGVSYKDLKVLGLEEGLAEIRFYYDEDELPESVGEDNLRFIYHRPNQGWEKAEEVSVEKDSNYVTGEVPVEELKGTPLAVTAKSKSEDGSRVVVHGPNPVPEEGCIFWFDLPEDSDGAKLILYNHEGREVFTEELSPGQERFPGSGRWEPISKGGEVLPEGFYLYRVKIVKPEGVSWSEVGRMVIGG